MGRCSRFISMKGYGWRIIQMTFRCFNAFSLFIFMVCFSNAIRFMYISLDTTDDIRLRDEPIEDTGNRMIPTQKVKSEWIHIQVNASTLDLHRAPQSNYSQSTLDQLQRKGNFSFLPDFENPCFVENDRLRCLPSFFVAGFPKCGTTDMYSRLTTHRHIGTHVAKEIHWLHEACGNKERDRGKVKDYFLLETYLSRFDECVPEILASLETNEEGAKRYPYILGDFSPSTVWNSPHFKASGLNPADCVRDLLPSSKVIIMLRDPVDRLYSDYVYTRPRKNNKITSGSPRDFHARADAALKRFEKCANDKSVEQCVMEDFMVKPTTKLPGLIVCFYHVFVARWLDRLPRDQIHVIKFEDYALDPNNYISTHVLPFLGRDPFNDIELQQLAALGKRNSSPEFPRMLNNTRAMLKDFFRPFNQKLALLLNDPNYIWEGS